MAVPNKPAVTFVLPGDGRSGGVRVTVIMANLLRQRGYPVRIALPHPRETLRTRLSRLSASLFRRDRQGGFLHEFTGEAVRYGHLDELAYRDGEIVIAVGTYSVPDVRALTKPAIKLRFNHGFPARPDALQEQAWRGSMPTITVSNTLVPRLERESGEKVLAVVPNGIDTKIYYPDAAVVRDGIGAVYNGHPNKAPEDMRAVLAGAHQKWPTLPQYIFSTERQPAELSHARYTQLPTVDEARRIYSRSRIWLLTSRTEGLPGVVLEAMACGCVVISTDNDGSLEILRHEQNGIIVPRGDVAAFLSAIERLQSDDALVGRLAAGALESVKRFTWSAAGDRMEAVLAQLTDRQSRT
jgi:glycosyltransferase involved in cell wall biosynthesis